MQSVVEESKEQVDGASRWVEQDRIVQHQVEEEGHTRSSDKDIVVGIVEHDVWLKSAKKLVRETNM